MTPAEWKNVRRPVILELFRANVYGRAPLAKPENIRCDVTDTTTNALSGRATRKMVDIHFSGPGGQGTIHLAVFIPNGIPGPVPGFLLICNRPDEYIDPSRGTRSPFWPVEQIVDRGYMTAAFSVADVDPDTHDGFTNGVHGIFDRKDIVRPGDAWGAIAAWAWGASRAMDYLETDSAVDKTRVAVIGHSRGGKTALWCGAEDERFALVISNESGCAGAALARRKQGETVEAINRRFPHWFCSNYKAYNDKEGELPVDQHELIALIAPRIVYVASAKETAGLIRRGSFLHASMQDRSTGFLACVDCRAKPCRKSKCHYTMATLATTSVPESMISRNTIGNASQRLRTGTGRRWVTGVKRQQGGDVNRTPWPVCQATGE